MRRYEISVQDEYLRGAVDTEWKLGHYPLDSIGRPQFALGLVPPRDLSTFLPLHDPQGTPSILDGPVDEEDQDDGQYEAGVETVKQREVDGDGESHGVSWEVIHENKTAECVERQPCTDNCSFIKGPS